MSQFLDLKLAKGCFYTDTLLEYSNMLNKEGADVELGKGHFKVNHVLHKENAAEGLGNRLRYEKPFYPVAVLKVNCKVSMDWRTYIERMERDDIHDLEKLRARLELMNNVTDLTVYECEVNEGRTKNLCDIGRGDDRQEKLECLGCSDGIGTHICQSYSYPSVKSDREVQRYVAPDNIVFPEDCDMTQLIKKRGGTGIKVEPTLGDHDIKVEPEEAADNSSTGNCRQVPHSTESEPNTNQDRPRFAGSDTELPVGDMEYIADQIERQTFGTDDETADEEGDKKFAEEGCKVDDEKSKNDDEDYDPKDDQPKRRRLSNPPSVTTRAARYQSTATTKAAPSNTTAASKSKTVKMSRRQIVAENYKKLCDAIEDKPAEERTYIEKFATCKVCVGGLAAIFCEDHQHIDWSSYWAVEKVRTVMPRSRYNKTKKMVDNLYAEQKKVDLCMEARLMPGRLRTFFKDPCETAYSFVTAICTACNREWRDNMSRGGCAVHRSLRASMTALANPNPATEFSFHDFGMVRLEVVNEDWKTVANNHPVRNFAELGTQMMKRNKDLTLYKCPILLQADDTSERDFLALISDIVDAADAMAEGFNKRHSAWSDCRSDGIPTSLQKAESAQQHLARFANNNRGHCIDIEVAPYCNARPAATKEPVFGEIGGVTVRGNGFVDPQNTYTQRSVSTDSDTATDSASFGEPDSPAYSPHPSNAATTKSRVNLVGGPYGTCQLPVQDPDICAKVTLDEKTGSVTVSNKEKFSSVMLSEIDVKKILPRPARHNKDQLRSPRLRTETSELYEEDIRGRIRVEEDEETRTRLLHELMSGSGEAAKWAANIVKEKRTAILLTKRNLGIEEEDDYTAVPPPVAYGPERKKYGCANDPNPKKKNKKAGGKKKKAE